MSSSKGDKGLRGTTTSPSSSSSQSIGVKCVRQTEKISLQLQKSSQRTHSPEQKLLQQLRQQCVDKMQGQRQGKGQGQGQVQSAQNCQCSVDREGGELCAFWNSLPVGRRRSFMRISKQELFAKIRAQCCSKCFGFLLSHYEDLRADSEQRNCELPFHLCVTPNGCISLSETEVRSSGRDLMRLFHWSKHRLVLPPKPHFHGMACGFGWFRRPGQATACLLHTETVDYEELYGYWYNLEDETMAAYFQMNEEDFVAQVDVHLKYQLKICKDCRGNVLQQFKELKKNCLKAKNPLKHALELCEGHKLVVRSDESGRQSSSVLGNKLIVEVVGPGDEAFWQKATDIEDSKDANAEDGGAIIRHAETPELAQKSLCETAMLIFKSQVEAGLRDQMADEVTLDLFHCMCLSYLEDLLKVEHQKLKVCAFQEELLLEEQQERDLAIEKAKEKAERKRLKKQRQKNKVNESLITQNLQSESHSTHQQHGACNLSHQGDSGNQHKEFNLKMHNCEESMNNNKTKGQKESQQKRNQKSKGRQGQGRKLDSQNCNKNDGPRQNGKSKQQCSEEVEHDVKSNDSVADSVTELYALNGAQEVQCVSQTHQAENVVTNNFDDLCPILDHSIIMAAVNMEDSDEIYEEYADYKDPDEEQYDRYVLISDEDYEDEEEAVARIDQVSKDSAEDFEVIHSHNHSKTKGCSSSTDVYEYQYRSYPNKHTPSRTTLTPSSTPPRQHPHRDACHLHNHHQNQQVQQKFSQVQSQFQGVKWPRMPAINQSQNVQGASHGLQQQSSTQNHVPVVYVQRMGQPSDPSLVSTPPCIPKPPASPQPQQPNSNHCLPNTLSSQCKSPTPSHETLFSHHHQHSLSSSSIQTNPQNSSVSSASPGPSLPVFHQPHQVQSQHAFNQWQHCVQDDNGFQNSPFGGTLPPIMITPALAQSRKETSSSQVSAGFSLFQHGNMMLQRTRASSSQSCHNNNCNTNHYCLFGEDGFGATLQAAARDV